MLKELVVNEDFHMNPIIVMSQNFSRQKQLLQAQDQELGNSSYVHSVFIKHKQSPYQVALEHISTQSVMHPNKQLSHHFFLMMSILEPNLVDP